MSSIAIPGFSRARTRVAGIVHGGAAEAAWARPAGLGVTLAALVLYLWGLDRNGWANSYYSAAVQAGAQSWKAFFFGSLDAGNFITVDKPPASLWLMELSARIFGVSSWSILAPEAVAGALAVLLMFATVRRTFGPLAGVIAALFMALTPVAVLMFRFNNPDALLTLLLVASAWALVRALDGGKTRWLVLSAALVGLAFNTKDLQAFIVLPALVGTYFLFGPGRVGRRFMQLLAAGVALAVSAGWWMTIVDLIPASARPYIGGSSNNTVLDLVLGYNGLGRIFGQGGPAGGGGGGGAGFGGAAGWGRLFNSEIGGQVTWLIPLAVAGLVAGLWLRRGAGRCDLARAGFVLWGAWFATHFAVFSLASGIFHPYYTVALAPGIAALAGAGLVAMWRWRSTSTAGALFMAAAVAITGWWGSQLLARTPSFMPGLGTVELVAALGAAALIAVSGIPALRTAIMQRAAALAFAAAVIVLLMGPIAYDVATVSATATGAIPSAGPVVASSNLRGPGADGFASPPSGIPPAGVRDGGSGGAGIGGATSSELITYLLENQGTATWLVAVPSSMSASSIELATGKPVLAMGGFSGSDPAMTVAKLQALVASGQLRYVMLSGGGPGGANSAVQDWVVANGKAITVGGATIYDLASSATG